MTEESVVEWFDSFSSSTDKEVIGVIAPAYHLLSSCAREIDARNLDLRLGVQDVSPYGMGAYTGEVAADQLSGVDYAIVGHSERRKYFGETSSMVAAKTERALEAKLTPVVCIDEPYLEEQLAALDQGILSQCIFAFEPLRAIGSGNPDTPDHVQAVATRIQALAGEVGVLYGGSIDEDNFGYFLNEPAIVGGLVGGASLTGKSFGDLMALAGGSSGQ